VPSAVEVPTVTGPMQGRPSEVVRTTESAAALAFSDRLLAAAAKHRT